MTRPELDMIVARALAFDLPPRAAIVLPLIRKR